MSDFRSKLTINHPSLIDKKNKDGDGYQKEEKREQNICFLLFRDSTIFTCHPTLVC